MTLEEFLRLLPTAPRFPLALSEGELDKHGLEVPAPYPRFVPPTLREETPARAGGTSVVLISAPGAVGKTTLAREIACAIGSPLWQLGKVNVGHEFLTGAIARAFGDDRYSSVKRELLEGQRALVLDGLDEARLRALEANFEAFLEHLADDFRTPGSHPALVLLGRADIIEDTATWLELLDVPYGRYEIEYFDQEAAVDFIAKYLTEQSEHRPHETNPGEFAAARDMLLDRLEKAVPEGVSSRSLAGYAPVLELVSRLLDVRNPWGEYQDISREAAKWKLSTLVRQIAVGILDREHAKTVDKLPVEVKGPGADSFDWSRAYQADEQCLRLLATHAHITLEDPPPYDLPPELRDSYERKLTNWVSDHPFTSQPLFLDYVYAWLFVREDAPPALSGAVRQHLQQVPETRPPYRPTPLLARFVADFGAVDEDRPELRVRAGDLGFVYESVLAGAPGGQRPKLTLISAVKGDDILGEITTGVSADAPQRGQRFALRLRDDGGGAWLWRHLSHADIDVMHDVRIGAPRVDFVLGPDVTIDCAKLTCESSAVRVISPSEESAVVLTAHSYEGQSVEFLGRHEERVSMRVHFDPLQYPWNRYKSQDEPVTPVGPEIREAFLRLRRILVRFRAEGYADIGRHEDLIDNAAIGGSDAARRLLQFCIERRLIRRDRPWYVLDRQTMDQLGINWTDIRERRISEPIARFLGEFVEGES